MNIELVQHLPEPLPASVAFWWSNIANGYRVQLRLGDDTEIVQAPVMFLDREQVVEVVESLATQYRVPVYEIEILKMDIPLRTS